MKIEKTQLSSYELPLTFGDTRHGLLVRIENEKGQSAEGDAAPLPGRSQETLQEALHQLKAICKPLRSVEWTLETYLEELLKLNLLPSVHFAIESALLSLIDPMPVRSIDTAALLMGHCTENILKIAALKQAEGYTCAKLKIGNLSFEDAIRVTTELKNIFKLRIDINNAWPRPDCLRFFSLFPLDSFDFVEDPLPHFSDLKYFPHPLAIDMHLTHDCTLSKLESLPNLKAIVYKPTVQGGLTKARHMHHWAKQHGIKMIISSSFESDIGHLHLIHFAQRLGLTEPIGIGSYHYLKNMTTKPILTQY